MNPSLVTLLTSLGLGQYVLVASAIVGVLSVAMPFLPVASATSPKAYQVAYGILAWVTFNFGKVAPVPANGLPAGGLVPAIPKETPHA